MDPQSCAACHPDSYREWSGSMHAYAAEDPVFIAMNARAQRETNGALGDFCVRCHAPVAVAEGLTKDGLNLAQLEPKYRGVTCFFCHSIEAVEGTHNAPIRLAKDGVLRAGIADPVPNGAHRSAYSPLLDRTRLDSSKACGACHDIVTPGGSHIERSFLEWQNSVFSKAPGGATCGQCHMPRSPVPEPIAVGAPPRWRHGHASPGVDVALTPFPEASSQQALVQDALDETLQTGLCVQPLGPSTRVQVIIDNVGAGHGFPSGAAADRRAWVEVVATKEGETVYESGVVARGEDVTKLDDPDLWLLRDCLFDQAGNKVHPLWQAFSWESNTLPAAMTLDPLDPRFYQTHFARTYPGPGRRMAAAPDRVRARIRLQPIGYDVLDELVATGDLSREIRDRMVVHDLNRETTLEWSATAPTVTWIDRETSEVWSCVTTSNMNLRADRTPAPVRTRCGP